MKILTINAGSSSMKFSVIELPEEKELINGYFQRIGMDKSFYDIKVNGEKIHKDVDLPDHLVALECIKKDIVEQEVVSNLDEIDGIGHRIVHGGEEFKENTLLTDDVIERLSNYEKLAKLHMPPIIKCIKAAKEAFPGIKMVGVFDTSFHQTMKKREYMYALPYEWYEKYGVRKYGFHGTSHKFINREITTLLKKDDLKVISCHIGSGASICAISSGKVVDTSMGFSPMSGIMMGTRPGDMDASVVEYVMDQTGMSVSEVMDAMNKQSGLLGVCGESDSRDVENGIATGDEKCILAQDMLTQKIANYIAMYNNLLGGADVIVLTAGLGENSKQTRIDILEKLPTLGITIDKEANDFRGEVRKITTDDSKIPVYVIPTNEELMIAIDTFNLVK